MFIVASYSYHSKRTAVVSVTKPRVFNLSRKRGIHCCVGPCDDVSSRQRSTRDFFSHFCSLICRNRNATLQLEAQQPCPTTPPEAPHLAGSGHDRCSPGISLHPSSFSLAMQTDPVMSRGCKLPHPDLEQLNFRSPGAICMA